MKSDWNRLLADRPAWSPEDGPLLVVAPHPDDEVLGAGGLIRAWAARGARVSVLSVSDEKARAVRCFRSQISPRCRDPIAPAHVLSHLERPYEAFLL